MNVYCHQGGPTFIMVGRSRATARLRWTHHSSPATLSAS
jgi:hypothetical protein